MRMKTDRHSYGASQNMGNKERKVRTQYHAVTLLMVVLAMALFIFGNLIFYVLDHKVDLDVDMTSQKMYSLSAEAKNFLSLLEKDVTITIFQDEEKFDSRTLEAFYNYKAASRHIIYQYVDIQMNPSFADNFYGAKLTDTSILIYCGEKFQVLEEKELYYLNETAYYTTILGIKIDQKLCSAISSVTSDERHATGRITGHGETITSELVDLCETAGREIVDIDLLTQDIADEVDVLLLCEPSVDFDSQEIKKIEDFLDRGDTNLIVFLDAQVGELPMLQQFLEEWGLRLKNNIVIDGTYYWGGSQTYLLAGLVEGSAVGQAIEAENVVMPLSQEIEIVESVMDSYETFPILCSGATAYAKEVDAELNTLEKVDSDREGPFLLAAGSYKERVRDNATYTSSIFVYGSAAMTADTFLSSASLGNREVILDTLCHGKQKMNIMSIQPIYIRDLSLNMTSTQVNAWRTVLIAVLPVAICAVGTVIWYRRKKR